jgi:hypothetical protein
MKGTIVKADIGSGAWLLEADDGKRYQLNGRVPANLAGRRVEVSGKPVEAFGFAMTGDPALDVDKITPL